MDIRLFLYFIVIVFGIYFADKKKTNSVSYNKSRRAYITIVCFFLILESTLRGVYVVSDDTYFYMQHFRRVQSMSWSELMNIFYLTIEGKEKDPGYSVFVKLIQLIISNFRLYLFLIAIGFFIPLGKILYKYTSDYLQLIFAFVLFVSLFNVVILSGIRQQIATSFSFWAFLALADNKRMKAIIIILIGMSIHISCSLMFLLLGLGFIKRFLKPLHMASFIAIPLVITFGGFLALLLASLSPNEYYKSYGQHEAHMGSINYVLCMTTASLLAFFALKRPFIDKSLANKYLYASLPLATFLAPLIMQGPSLIRLGQYFTLYFMITVPLSIDSFLNKDTRIFVYIVVIVFLMVLTLRRPFDYYFFWNETVVL